MWRVNPTQSRQASRNHSFINGLDVLLLSVEHVLDDRASLGVSAALVCKLIRAQLRCRLLLRFWRTALGAAVRIARLVRLQLELFFTHDACLNRKWHNKTILNGAIQDGKPV